MRVAEPSMRPITPAISDSGMPPRRYSSEYPLTVASGVRSSWLASLTKRFIFSSLARCTAKDSSIRPSMVFSDAARDPTSVDSGPPWTRLDRSPPAMPAAVVSICCSGRRLERTTR